MTSVFWDAHWILLIQYVLKGITIMAVQYWKTLRDLRPAICWKRPEFHDENVLLLHDTAYSHAMEATMALL